MDHVVSDVVHCQQGPDAINIEPLCTLNWGTLCLRVSNGPRIGDRALTSLTTVAVSRSLQVTDHLGRTRHPKGALLA